MLNKLLREGKIKNQSTTPSQIKRLLKAARMNLKAAEIVRGNIDEAAFKLYYDGLLQIARIILLANGYRPDDGEQHKTTFLVAGAFLGSDFRDLIDKAQKFRIKRNLCLYEPTGFMGSKDTEAIHETAQQLWQQVKGHLKYRHLQLDLFDDL